jgi:hypothetical protein
MVDRMAQARFLAVLGPSGSGKSSLVRSGLYTSLELGVHPKASGLWNIADFAPGRSPLQNLARALVTALPAVAQPSPGEQKATGWPRPLNPDMVLAQLQRGPRAIVEMVNSGVLDPGWNLLISVDQFEELFRFRDYGEREEVEAFVALLIESANADTPIHVVVTMRSEYLGLCSLIPGLAEQISSGLYLLPRMLRDECQEAIEKPAILTGFEVQPVLVTRILNDLQCLTPFETSGDVAQAEQLASQADQLPLMQHVLNLLWRRAPHEEDRPGRVLTLAAYNDLGGLTGALDTHGREVMLALAADFNGDPDLIVGRVFRALVDGTALHLAVRRPQSVSDLVDAAGGVEVRASVLRILGQFEDAHFLRLSGDVDEGETVVDLSHESLIRQWTRLREWFELERDARIYWQRLTEAASDWCGSEMNVLRGGQLRRYSEWWERVRPGPSFAKRYGGNFDENEDLISASIAVAAREAMVSKRQAEREKQLMRIGMGILVAFAIAMTGITTWALNQKVRADQEKTLADNAQIQLVQNYADTTSRYLTYRRLIRENYCRGSHSDSELEDCVDTMIRLNTDAPTEAPHLGGAGSVTPNRLGGVGP